MPHQLPSTEAIAQVIIQRYPQIPTEVKPGLELSISRALMLDRRRVNDELQQLLGNQNMELRQAIEALLHPKG